jgi:subtilisin-like proprotein convertase family protein
MRSTLLLVLLAACTADTEPTDLGPVDNDPSLSSADAIFEGWPGNEMLPSEGKADGVYPAQFNLAMTQSPVRNQASRGVCSIFATIGLMEHLYIREGSYPEPDFSEQYLQWSAKFEANGFPNTSGSSADVNLRAISDFGIPEESAWPYETTQWNASNDPACSGTGDGLPTRCYTNGEPPASARMAERFRLPRNRWVNSSIDSLKGHMTATNTGVVVGLTFFYQAWNHRASTLPVNSERFRQGLVLSPNADDERASLMKRAGHAILLLGWDNDLEVQQLDAQGNPAVDAMGRPIMQKGFFLFKNSWGTGSFGTGNAFGPGYGWISFDYVRRHANAQVAGLPEITRAEICNDGRDNDGDRQADCDDSSCSGNVACMMPAGGYENTMSFVIPDNDMRGVTSTIQVAEGGEVAALSVTVDIEHSYRGDLRVAIAKGSREIVLHDQAGGGADNLQQTFSITDFAGEDAAGTWELRVSDRARTDTGTLKSWRLEVVRCMGTDCGEMPAPSEYRNTTGADIPDNNPSGVTSEITIPEGGSIRALAVTVDITHPYRGDLGIRLQKVGGASVVVHMADGSSEANLMRTFPLEGFTGQDARGTWRLTVIDEASSDMGRLNSWSLQVMR